MSATLPEVRLGYCTNEWRSSRFVEKAREILLPALGRSVVINSYLRVHSPQPLNDGDFHVYIWASASGSHEAGNGQRSSTLFGLEIGSTEWNWYGPSGLGEKIQCPEGAVIAELVGDNLYIFVPINDDRLSRVGSDIFGRLLQFLVDSGKFGPPLTEEQRAARIREICKKSFITSCNARTAHNFSATESAIHKKEVGLETSRSQLLNGILRLEASRTLLRRPVAPVDEQKFGREFDELLRVPKVRHVVVVNNKIEVYTDTIFCRDPRTKNLHELGRFRICMDVFRGQILWINLTRRVSGHKKNMHAPHVFDGGEACLGDAAEPLMDLLCNFEISALAMYAIKFLEDVNVDDDSGKYVDRWPLARDQNAT